MASLRKKFRILSREKGGRLHPMKSVDASPSAVKTGSVQVKIAGGTLLSGDTDFS
jgi:hypothetical protein